MGGGGGGGEKALFPPSPPPSLSPFSFSVVVGLSHTDVTLSQSATDAAKGLDFPFMPLHTRTPSNHGPRTLSVKGLVLVVAPAATRSCLPALRTPCARPVRVRGGRGGGGGGGGGGPYSRGLNSGKKKQKMRGKERQKVAKNGRLFAPQLSRSAVAFTSANVGKSMLDYGKLCVRHDRERERETLQS